MANGHGGYRQPANPAQTSGPGANSRRTDGQPIRDLPNADYGEGQEFRSLQQSAPLPGAPATGGGGGGMGDMLAGLTGFDAPGDPNMPITAGAAMGDGPGLDALGLPEDPEADRKADAEFLRKYIPAMVVAASSDESSPAFRAYLRRVLAQQR